MIDIVNKSLCTGCTACKNACLQKAISMQMDNEGFYYPKTDIAKCNSCNLCNNICPVGNNDKLESPTFTVLAQNKNQEVRAISSAGGIIGAIYNLVFSKGGVAFGSGYNEDNTVSYMKVNSLEECFQKKIFSSKYTSSLLGDIFCQIKTELLTGKLVCFVGLPCHVAGLKNYLKRKYSNLILVDLTCYGVPSQKLYEKYLSYIENKYKKKIVDVRFRDKSFGYAAPTMCLEFSDGTIRSQRSDIKSYLRCFFSNLSSRPSCYNCKFKTVDRVSDITVGDCRSVHKFSKNMDDDLGTTVLYIHSNKGAQVLKAIENEIVQFPVSVDDILKTSGKKMVESAHQNPEREKFYSEIDILPYSKLVNKYCPAKLSEHIINLFKGALLITGLNKTGILKKIKKR